MQDAVTRATHSGQRRHPARCGPRRKRRYPSEFDADRAAAQRSSEGETRPLRSYWCTWCHGWHLTHAELRTG